MENRVLGKANSMTTEKQELNNKAAQIDPIFEVNRPKFKKVFLAHSFSDKMSFQDLFKFCKQCGIIPVFSS